MAKTVTLKDGTEVLVRQLGKDDFDRSFAFFKDLPPEDRAYLRTDVTKPEVIRRRIQEVQLGSAERLVALVEDRIVADGALLLQSMEWKAHLGEIRLIVARPFQRLGLGVLMARELYLSAVREKVEELIVRFMRPQLGAMRIFRRLGFKDEAILPEYVRDVSGRKQDLIVMRCDLQALRGEIEDYLKDTDWRRMR